MASARPVILSPLPAAGEAVTQGIEGFILRSAEEEEELVHILQRCAVAPNQLVIMGRAARQRMETDLDQNSHAQRLKELLERPRGLVEQTATSLTAAA